ncbi:MAG: hypothetical protein LBG18_07800 [Mediterranea sp.]|jgi:hypothetical protein|nr:hypothetical protein [Mediterranea sp.]
MKFIVKGNITQSNIAGDNKIEFRGEGKVDTPQEPKYKKDNWLYLMMKSKWFLIGIIILLLGWILFLHFQTITNPNDITLILAFVGILTTFIVISNYAQVQEIKGRVQSYIEEMDRAKEDVIDARVGLGILRAESLISSDPIRSIAYYLYTITIGLDSFSKIEDVRHCIESIKCIDNIKHNDKTIDYKDVLGDSKKYSIRVDEITFDDFIDQIQSHKNYSVIKSEFERLIHNKEIAV